MIDMVKRFWRLILVLGGINVLLGLCMIATPYVADKKIGIVPLLLALMILLGGVFSAISVIMSRGPERSWMGALQVVLRFATGLMILFSSLDRSVTLTTLLGIYFGLDGALILGIVARVRHEKEMAAALLILGVTSVLFSLLIWLWIAGSPMKVIAAILGITFLIRGGVIIRGGLVAKNLPADDSPAAPEAPLPASGE
jgi:uncharacterized membrane protein HdeD (DUF308 family)